MRALGTASRWFDLFQRRHASLAFLLAVRQKYSEDQGGYLAATVAYYAFFSLLPLLLLLITGLGYALSGDPSLQRRVLHSVLVQFPIIGPQLQRNVHSLRGSGLALAIGIGGSLWAGMGVALAAQNAMNHLWDVPFRDRPNPLRARLSALLLLLVFGAGAVLATALASLGSASSSFVVSAGGVLLSFLTNFLLVWAALRVLTVRPVSWRDLRLGALIGGGALVLLQTLGGFYVKDVLRNASSVYGFFGIVLGLLSWLYLSANSILLAAEANVVAHGHLWPRSFSVVSEQPPTAADRRSLTEQSEVEERRQDQEISVSFDDRDDQTTPDEPRR